MYEYFIERMYKLALKKQISLTELKDFRDSFVLGATLATLALIIVITIAIPNYAGKELIVLSALGLWIMILFIGVVIHNRIIEEVELTKRLNGVPVYGSRTTKIEKTDKRFLQ
jgi:hypothetical protein